MAQRWWIGGKLLEGWQIQGIISLATGFLFTPTANVERQHVGQLKLNSLDSCQRIRC